jgi:Flp pilus assembly protein TadG
MRLARDERGLVGKLLVLWLVFLALMVVALFDVGSIVFARLRVADLAQDASFASAQRFDETGERRQAVRAALASIASSDEDARLSELEISRRGEVTVVVTDQATTLLAGRIGFLDHLAIVTGSDTTSA